LNGNLNLNLRQGKINFFVTTGYNQSGGRARGETNRQNKSNGIIDDYFYQLSVNERSRRFYSLRFGVDYFIDNRNTLSVTQDFGRGRSSNNEEQSQQYLDNNQALVYNGDRIAESNSRFNRNSSRLSYKHSFPQMGRELTADITYNSRKNPFHSNILNSYFYPDGSEYQPPSRVRNEGEGHNKQLTIQADYAHPFGESTKLEIGARNFQSESRSFLNAFALGSIPETKLPLSNNYKYKETVTAIYGTFSVKKESYSYQFGLRAEHSKFTGLLIDSAFKFGYEYPAAIKNIWDAIFPSLFFTKQVSETVELFKENQET
jgi:hypothetical protein